MKKIYQMNGNNIVITTDLIDDDKICGEPVMKICWEGLSCGVYFGMESNNAYVFAENNTMFRFISATWDLWEVTADMKQAHRSEGIDGEIETCVAFVTAFAIKMAEMVTEVKKAV